MSNCTSSCKTQDHDTYGECLKQNTPMFMGVSPTRSGWDQDQVKKDEKELASYRSAIAQGIEPRSTRTPDIEKAVAMSETAGKAFDGINLTFKN